MLSDRYQLTERIAAGGMGEVWRGVDLMLQRAVAVKVLLPALTADKEFITRFRTEARMMAALRHPGIVQVYDYGSQAPVDYLVMEHIDGIPLSRRIADAGRLSPAETMTIVSQMAGALQVAHEAGIVHRDVKPGNLLIRPGGAIVLVDFGIARSTAVTGITSTNVVLGSVNYMAPEQAEGKPISAATDVYALGGVAYCCLTGRPPYAGENALAVLTQLVHGELPTLPPDVPPAVAAVVLRALAKEPARRFPSAAAMAQAAQAAVRGGTSAFPPHSTAFGASAQPGTGGGAALGQSGARAAYGPGNTGGRPAYGAGNTGARPAYGSGGAGAGPAFGPGNTGARPAYGSGNTGGRPAYGQSNTGARAAFGQAGTPARGVSVPPAYGARAMAGSASVPRPSTGEFDALPGAAVASPGSARRRNKGFAIAAAAIALGLAGITAGIVFRPGATEAGIPPSDNGGVVTEAPESADPAPTRTKTSKPTRTKTRAPATSSPPDRPSVSPSATGEDEPDETESPNPTGGATGPGEICASGPSDDCD
ncbi:MAG: protein kinase [Actinoplanes sp.]